MAGLGREIIKIIGRLQAVTQVAGHETYSKKYLCCTNARPSSKVVSQVVSFQFVVSAQRPGKWILLFLMSVTFIQELSANSSRIRDDWLMPATRFGK